MDANIFFLVSLFCFLAHLNLCFSASGQAKSFDSVPDLERSMYTQIEGYPCVRLLNISGEIGCSNPGRGKVIAPVVRFKNANELVGSATVLVSVDEFEGLLSSMLNLGSSYVELSEDPDFSRKVAGVLVETRTQIQNGLKGNSPDVKFPQAEFAPYNNNNYEWNPSGSGFMWKAYNFPVFLLSDNSTSILQEVVLNEKGKKSHTEDVAEFDLVMQTTKSGTHNSDSCLKEGTCLPLGGYSVWSALPPINISSTPKTKPIVLTMTSIDSASFFRDKSLGAESPISGLITLLAAVDALSHIEGLDKLNKQLVFLVLTGEAWGYLGSRRFLLESDQQSDAVEGLDLAMIDMVMEIGSVGKGYSQGINTFFAHTAGMMSSVNGTLDALRRAQVSLKTENIVVKTASTSNPGVPPSSMMTFLKKRQTSGLVLEDFDTSFTNKFYHSHLDDLSNINSSAIVAAASLVARTLYILASGDNDSAINTVKINASLVEELLTCLLDCEPGLSCDLLKQYISPSTKCPSHYVGVILGEPSSAPYLGYVGDISRFVWNFLADKTSIPSKNLSSTCPKNCNGVGELCIKEEADEKGICVISTTRYVPAYSTRLKYDSGSWTILPINSSDATDMEDPVWTESNWDTIKVRVYRVQHAAYDHLILLLGIVVTLLAYLFILIARTFIRKALKQD